MSTIIYMSVSYRSNQIVPGLPQRIRTERERLGMSQEAFAREVGVTRVTQNYYENSVREPSLAYLSACGNIGVDILYLLFAELSEAEYVDLINWELFAEVWDWVQQVTVDANGRPYSGDVQKKVFRLAYHALRKNRISSLQETDLTLLLSAAV